MIAIYWYRWNWIIKSFLKKIHWEGSLFCDVFFSTYFCIFHCILPVPTPQYTIILLLLPIIMLRCCCYKCTEHLTSRYVKKICWVFLFIGFLLFFYPISAFFSVFLPLLPWCMLFNSYYTPLLITLNMKSHLIASNNIIFCMSCYYHSHLIISYLAQILGFWVTCGVKMMWLCHGWGWRPP